MAASVEDDLTPGRWNFTRTRGDVMVPTTFTVTIDGAPATTGAVAQVREGRDTASPLVLDLDATPSGSSVTVGDGLTLDIDPGDYWWDLEVDGLTVVYGRFRVLRDVSEVTP